MSYSNTKVKQTGRRISDHDFGPSSDDFDTVFDVFAYWRDLHEEPLINCFRKLIPAAREMDKNAIFGRRLKRYASVRRKLQRNSEKPMSLSNMHDVGGCRAVVSSSKQLQRLVRVLRKLPEFQFEDDKGRRNFKCRDYVKHPKLDGYRGYHLIGSFCDGDLPARKIEVQVRTTIQHCWATSLEIVDLFTAQSLKTDAGQKEWKEFFQEISLVLAQLEEFPSLDPTIRKEMNFEQYIQQITHQRYEGLLELCVAINKRAQKLKVSQGMKVYSESLKFLGQQQDLFEEPGYVLVIVAIDPRNSSATLTRTFFPLDQFTEASLELKTSEKDFEAQQNKIVALISTSKLGDLKEAYPNFYADSQKFVDYLALINYLSNVQLKRPVTDKEDY